MAKPRKKKPAEEFKTLEQRREETARAMEVSFNKALPSIRDLPNITGEKLVILDPNYKPDFLRDNMDPKCTGCGQDKDHPHGEFKIVAKVVSERNPEEVRAWKWRCVKCGRVMITRPYDVDKKGELTPPPAVEKRLDTGIAKFAKKAVKALRKRQGE